jgi:membrane-bound lytic murein transglycosylase D
MALKVGLYFAFAYLVLMSHAPVPAAEPDLVQAVRLPESLFFCGEEVPVDRPDIRERFEREMLLTLGNRLQVILWLKRAPRYLPAIVAELKSRNMPEDLQYLAVIESALLPHVGSSKGAIGFWQMMPETAQRYGLQVDAFVDDRRDLWRSTPAALQYLQDSYQRLGSWMLAAAAYNMGEEGLIAEILEQKTHNYIDLYLSLETQRYLFRILTAKLVMENPARYGFNLQEEDLYAALPFQTATIEFAEETPISLLAGVAGTTFKQIKELNPHVRGHYILPGRHEIRLPPPTPDNLQERLDKQLSDYLEERRQRIYIVRSGDNLSTIAKNHNVPLAALLIWNRINPNRPIHPGDRLVIYPQHANDQFVP